MKLETNAYKISQSVPLSKNISNNGQNFTTYSDKLRLNTV